MAVPEKPRPQRTTPLGVLRSVSETEAADFAGGPASALEGSGLYRLLVESVVDYAIFALDAGGNILS
ncbi:MAG TPA: hypothetical protein VIB55_20535 [Longimicrobium sp.]|jgi:hypothetical protein